MRTFHILVTDELHEALRIEAAVAHRPATEIVRDALTGWLAARHRPQLAAEIEAFALAEAGTRLDLDHELEAVGIEELVAGATS